MKTFYCDNCGSLVFFENVQCVKCGSELGFIPGILDVSALKQANSEASSHSPSLILEAGGQYYRRCQNWTQHQVCNWCVPVADKNPFCIACRTNRTIPDLTVVGNLERWGKMEQAKRRLIYGLLRLGLSLDGDLEDDRPPLQFDFLADLSGMQNIVTGHDNGLITMNIIEADDAEREKLRVSFQEPYRTLLGHFRHESAHYYWGQLIANRPGLEPFREMFGDDTQDYATALNSYYQLGATGDWQTRFVSAYASSHPWEDWAETFAHYLHIVDMIETATSFGMSLTPKHPDAKAMTADPKAVFEAEANFDKILAYWLPLTYALNSLSRGMGLPDLYPFLLSVPAIQKLDFIHQTLHGKG